MDPLPEEDFVFSERIVGGTVPRQYIPGVEKGVRESLDHGPIAGYPVVNVKVTLTDGAYHTVDSNEMAFKIASSQAFKEAMQRAQPTLLEPVMALRITIPGSYTGDIISDLNGKRAHVQGAMPEDDTTTIIEATAPLAEIQRYATDLRQLTQGQGIFEMTFDHYQKVPPHLADGIISAARGCGGALGAGDNAVHERAASIGAVRLLCARVGGVGRVWRGAVSTAHHLSNTRERDTDGERTSGGGAISPNAG